MENILNIFNSQKEFFYSNKTKDINYRINNLKKLKNLIKENEQDIMDALYKDLRKSNFESYATEIGIVYDELNLHIKNLRKWSKREKRKSPIVHFPAKSYIYKDPYGVTLIIGPFNYPFQLVIAPLIGAISAGNCAIIKPSESTQNIALLLEKIINENFKENYIRVVNPLGGKDTVSYLLDLKFDYIFFTGSVSVGKIIMEKASKNLIPVTLELGGKSPCIVDNSAKLDLAAKRIVWGKFLNAGQTCVAPDYILVQKDIKEKLLKELKKELLLQFGSDIKSSSDFPRIVNKHSLLRLKNYLNDGEIYFGGSVDEKDLYLEPTILTNIKENSLIMEEEIFGPILPILEYSSLDEALTYVINKDKPLALYYFSEDSTSIEKVLNSTTSGGVTINDTIIHVASSYLPFGGVGSSGMGAYHGKASFDVFTHKKSVIKRGTFIEFPIKFAPYNNKINLLKKVMK
ncbi:MAG: aldehyde dehydrogenase [Clostridium sp.]|uniref:aldehyde dehydrogenase n=1 Tax=Clostridium TaxID=1485 RepID=UPI00115B94E7|nr:MULTISPECIES: aldehyde dehydrogenase [Clostridium]MBS5306312.1 aldehyde dehydrogenase [Clostridium sp.]MDB1943851.1 aldehyde dehydrogenase [Clostridium tertium]MDB1950983.1 aldehyde dehydrogenase [Clostridium tertium]MDU1567932.1 aldehyde dehydrogenase [Clostridium sp.]MDU2157213.1 aldehyde dehydrogenase [Clostridium sp.]